MCADRREPLTRQRIVEAAVAIADERGFGAVSMRRVAADVGYEVMSLYNHVANKRDLTTAMVEHVTLEIDLPEEHPDWRSAMRANAISAKEMFERHPWAVPLWTSAMPGPNRFDVMEWQLRTLAESGLDERRAHDAFHAIGNHVVGYMLSNQNVVAMDDAEAERLLGQVMAMLDDERHAYTIGHINQHVAGDTGPSFEFVLDLLIAGIAGD